ncbi:lasso peptide biosynthesis B2 protein [Altererythrobacter aquiaggeris]|uniref:lasso peptide biosynthesis B2 protein n=1 Tax=Aestuarierythrobacter aquiaggeris TaxID=1898396 RepID=UPI00301888A7
MEKWRHRLRVAEAMVLVWLSRIVIRRVSFGRWRGWLGSLHQNAPNIPPVEPADLRLVRALVAAASRAGQRLPASLCLPRAMALHIMLSRRGCRSALVFGILPGETRGSVDDLHAWVEINRQPVFGDTQDAHIDLFRIISHG